MKNDPPDTLLLDMKKDSPESLLLHSLELDIPTAQLAGNTLDREQMVWRRKRGGLLQPDWVIRIINALPGKIWCQKKIQEEHSKHILGQLMRLMREQEKHLLEMRKRKALYDGM